MPASASPGRTEPSLQRPPTGRSAGGPSARHTPPRRTTVPHVVRSIPRRPSTHMLSAVTAPPSSSLLFDKTVGELTHAVLARHFDDVRCLSPDRLADALTEAAQDAVSQAGVKRHRAAVMRVATQASRYVQLLAPPPFVEFLGSERPLGSGRTDLEFEHPTLGLLIDEVKTGDNTMAALDPAHEAQAGRYAAAVRRMGIRFAGVRLLPLSSPGHARLFLPGGGYAALSSTALSPGALAAQQRALTAAGGDLAALPAPSGGGLL